MNKKRVFELLAKAIDISYDKLIEFPANTRLDNIGIDSLKFIQFIVDIEEELHIKINDNDLILSKFETIEELFYTLEKYFDKTSMKKILISDCDNVLWRGVAGEEDIVISEVNIELQKKLIKLYEQGVLLCLCSKNQPANITRAFTHSSMLLKEEHILLAMIDYNNKPDNVKAIAKELNLSTESIVFLDDSDYEIGLMNAMLPEVSTVKFTYEDDKYLSQLDVYFDVSVTGSNRTQQYREQKEREKDKAKFKTVEEYNLSLQTQFSCKFAITEEAGRIAELSNRTKQFNLSDIRYTEKEIINLLEKDNYSILSFDVKDKYGDMGIVGSAVIKHEGSIHIIEGFFISCRAFGRGFEDKLLDNIRSLFGNDLVGIYRNNGKNERFANFYSSKGVTPYV